MFPDFLEALGLVAFMVAEDTDDRPLVFKLAEIWEHFFEPVWEKKLYEWKGKGH